MVVEIDVGNPVVAEEHTGRSSGGVEQQPLVRGAWK